MVTYYEFFINRVLPLFFDLSAFGGIGEKIFFYIFSVGCSLLIALPFVYLPVSLFVRLIRRSIRIK